MAALTFLPAVLLLIGRAAFWPAIPRLDHVHAQDSIGTRGLWGRVAALVGSHPRRTWVLTLTALLALAAFVPTLKADGISQSDLFLDKVESVTGQEVLAKHFPAGSGSPIQVAGARGQGRRRARRPGARGRRQRPVCRRGPGAPAKVVDGQVLVQATLTEAADSPAADRGGQAAARPTSTRSATTCSSVGRPR